MLKDVQLFELRGSPKRNAIGKKGYWYDQYRIGSDVVDRYLDEDSKDFRDRLAHLKELALRRKENERERSRLMGVLRAEGYLMADVQTGQVVSAMERAGVFRFGGTLLGTQALRLYESELGLRIAVGSSADGGSIDMAKPGRLSITLEEMEGVGLSDAFSRLKFALVPSRGQNTIWRWGQTDWDTMVEFVTPISEEGEEVRNLTALGVSARSQHYLDFLSADPNEVSLLYRSGALVRVPRPERFAIHKLIVAGEGKSDARRQKARKDRAQPESLFEVLSVERPAELAEAYGDAMQRGSAWRDRISATLAVMCQASKRIGAVT